MTLSVISDIMPFNLCASSTEIHVSFSPHIAYTGTFIFANFFCLVLLDVRIISTKAPLTHKKYPYNFSIYYKNYNLSKSFLSNSIMLFSNFLISCFSSIPDHILSKIIRYINPKLIFIPAIS